MKVGYDDVLVTSVMLGTYEGHFSRAFRALNPGLFILLTVRRLYSAYSADGRKRTYTQLATASTLGSVIHVYITPSVSTT